MSFASIPKAILSTIPRLFSNLTAPSAKFYPEGTTIFKKGNSISIKVSRKNHRSFVPEENGSTAEKILFSCGTFMIIAFCIMYFRYY